MILLSLLMSTPAPEAAPSEGRQLPERPRPPRDSFDEEEEEGEVREAEAAPPPDRFRLLLSRAMRLFMERSILCARSTRASLLLVLLLTEEGHGSSS